MNIERWMTRLRFIITNASFSWRSWSLIIGDIWGRNSLVTDGLIVLIHLVFSILFIYSTLFANDIANHIEDKAYYYFQSLVSTWILENIQVRVSEVFIMDGYEFINIIDVRLFKYFLFNWESLLSELIDIWADEGLNILPVFKAIIRLSISERIY